MIGITTEDMIFTIGTLCFLTSMIPAIRKLLIVDYSDAQSLVHNEITMIGHILMLILAIMIVTPFAIFVNIVSIVFRLIIIYLIRKKRSHKLKYKSDIVYYLINFVKSRIY